jgi:hypothetical protein
MKNVSATIGDCDGHGKRSVVLRHGDKEYPDVANLDSGFQREQLIRRALPALGLSVDHVPLLDAELARLVREKDKQTGDSKPRFPLVTCAALDGGDYTPTSIINDCLMAGHVAEIGGLFKSCKTLFAIDSAISIASGFPFLNAFTVVEPRSVLYFSGEGGPTLAQEYGRRIAASKGLSLSDVSNLHWCFSVPHLESLTDLDAMFRVIDEIPAEVVYIDNLILALSGDQAGNAFKMAGGALSPVINQCVERNITPVWIHHFKRTRAGADRFAPGELSDLTQAGAAEVAGQWLLLTRREDWNPEQPGEHRLWLNVGGRLGHGGLHAVDVHEGRRADPGGRRWEIEVLRPEDARQAVEDRQEQARATKGQEQLDRDKQKVIRAMVSLERQHPEGNATTAIRNRSYLKGQRFTAALESVVEDGTAVHCELLRSNHKTPTPGYKLRTEGVEE